MSGSRSVRAFVVVLLGYAGARTLWVWAPAMIAAPPPPVRTAMASARPAPVPGTGRGSDVPASREPRPARGPGLARDRLAVNRTQPLHPLVGRPADAREPEVPAPPGHGMIAHAHRITPVPAVVTAQPVAESRPPAPAARPRWSGYAYLFHRGDGGVGSTLAPAGQIGGSQAAARLAYRIDDAGRLAVAARVATPLRATAQAEAAVGIDLLPVAGLRLSIERRLALGSGGRNALAAYAAGGVYRALTPRIELDGYAQAGFVGARRRDPFADGALRVHRRSPVAPAADLRLGLAGWGAAQPGAARIDVGPRAALTVRTPRLPVTIAVEGRLRVAGRARPGNGVALTLATDF